jgi:hypothetical protein
VLRYQQQDPAANLSVAQLIVFESRGRYTQHVGELGTAQAEAFTQMAKALAASIIEQGDGLVTLVGMLFHG